MHGNVDEWCNDWYDSEYYEKCREEPNLKNPKGPDYGLYKVVRGGSWGDFYHFCRSSNRISFCPSKRLSFVGFRPVFIGKKAEE